VKREIKIISGGQTGVDRAALDVGLRLNIEVGGWCPEGRKAEDGTIPKRYPLKELPSGGYQERTHANVLDSDGTLIIFFNLLSGGTRLTRQFCRELQKPHLHIDGCSCTISRAAERLSSFTNDHRIINLNVAGPRASEENLAFSYTYDFLMLFFMEGVK